MAALTFKSFLFCPDCRRGSVVEMPNVVKQLPAEFTCGKCGTRFEAQLMIVRVDGPAAAAAPTPRTPRTDPI